MIAPTIHMNGTHKDQLFDAALSAKSALDAALTALAAIAPNARDYYVQGPQAVNEAMEDYRSMHSRVAAVADEIERLAIAISDQG